MSARDVVVVGAGVEGCGVAWRLAQAGVAVTLLERTGPGAEASSAAGGILAPQKEAEGPGPMLDLCLRSRAMYPALAEELKELTGIDIQYVPSGLFQVVFAEASLHKLEATIAWQRANGLRAELLDPAQARKAEPEISEKALGAGSFPDDHQVDNRLLVRALSVAAARAGVKFRTGNARGLIVEQDRVVGVDVDGERLGADAVVVAAGSWSGLIDGTKLDAKAVRPARGQMIEFQLRMPAFSRVLFTDRGGYLVPRRDGRVIAGSTMEFEGYEKKVTGAGLQRIVGLALELVPALGEAQVTNFWAGFRPYTEDHLPILGPGPLPGLFLATGHFRNGILMAPITARVVSESVLGKKTTLDLTPFRYDRPAGAGPTR